VFNLLDRIKANPGTYKQLSVDEQIVTEFTCPLESQRQPMWAEQDYIAYVLEGRKVWHTSTGAFDVTKGKCLYVRKGANVVEQVFGDRFCVVFFFLSDAFIASTLAEVELGPRAVKPAAEMEQICYIDVDESLEAFFLSVQPHFVSNKPVNKLLLALKFKELILNVVANENNQCVADYFHALKSATKEDKMRRVMEENFLYNLRLEDFARLCGKSLSSFKRDFNEQYGVTPGRWLLNRRLQHASRLIASSNKYMNEIAFECGFENPAHFSRAFKTAFGVSPADHRQKVALTLK